MPRRRRFFQGYYLRVVDHEQGRSIAVVIGSYKPRRWWWSLRRAAAAVAGRGGQGAPSARAFEEHYVCVMIDEETYHLFIDGADAAYEFGGSGPERERPNFDWTTRENGQLAVRGDSGSLSLTLPEVALRIDFTDRVPYAASDPDRGGPEGWLSRSALLPCRYFVYSLASRASYSLEYREPGPRRGGDAPVSGTGRAHVEANHGSNFPSGWVWVQACGNDGATQLSLVGGNFVIGGVAIFSWILAFRSPAANWTFRTTDGDRFGDCVFSRQEGALELSARARNLRGRAAGRRELRLRVQADPDESFGDPIYTPSASGWTNSPGCQEAHGAEAVVTLVLPADDAGGETREEVFRLDLAALEFGGDFLAT